MDSDDKYEIHVAVEKTKGLLSLFEKFIDICKSPSWPDNSTDSKQIVQSFEIACTIECFMCDNKNYSPSFCSFFKLFTKYYSHRHNRDVNFDQINFAKAANYILEKFLIVELESGIADIALTEYLKKCGESRLQSILKELILSSATNQVLKTYLDSKELDKETEINLRCELFLNDLQNKYELIDSIIKNLLCSVDNLNNLDTICRSLLLNNILYKEEMIAIEKTFCSVLNNSDSSSIWNSFLIDLDKILLVSISEKYPNIFKEIVSHLIRCSSHMFSEITDIDKTVWIVNRKASIFPNLSYNIIVDLVKLFTKNSNKMCSEFSNIVNSSPQNPPFWSSVFKDCGISNDELWKNLDSFFDEDIFSDS